MKKIFFVCLVFLLNGCASMFSGTQEEISIRSDYKDAKIYLNDEFIGTKQVHITIPKKKLSKSIMRVTKTGCEDTTRQIQTKFDGVSLLGCFIDFCIITVGVVDLGITGAVSEASQTSYLINPVCPQ